MSNADIKMIHLHQDLLTVQRERLEKEVSVFDGVTLARFSYSLKHWLVVVYDADSINANTILNRVRQWDRNATIF